jgi:hypothetical protein
MEFQGFFLALGNLAEKTITSALFIRGMFVFCLIIYLLNFSPTIDGGGEKSKYL